MEGTLVNERIVPAEYCDAFIVKSGQIVRMIATEGPQVVDVSFFNAHNYSESYRGSLSYGLNMRLGTGNGYTMKYFFSRLPRANIMMEIIEDTVGRHWVINSGHCNKFTNEIRGLPESARSCQDNIAEAISSYGMTPDQVPDTFALWMNVNENPGGDYELLPSLAKPGDYTDFLAHMDVLVAVSACPGSQKNITPINGDVNKPFKWEIWECPQFAYLR